MKDPCFDRFYHPWKACWILYQKSIARSLSPCWIVLIFSLKSLATLDQSIVLKPQLTLSLVPSRFRLVQIFDLIIIIIIVMCLVLAATRTKLLRYFLGYNVLVVSIPWNFSYLFLLQFSLSTMIYGTFTYSLMFRWNWMISNDIQ